MRNRKLSYADRKTPRLTLMKNKVGILNKAAINTMLANGETHMLVLRGCDGKPYLKPFGMEGLLTVTRIHNIKEHGPSRISLSCLDGIILEGDYEIVWNPIKGCAELKDNPLLRDYAYKKGYVK